MGCSASVPVKSQPAPSKTSAPELVGNYKRSIHDEFVKYYMPNETFGRDELIKEILAKHINTPANNAKPLLLFGKSGSGKSTFLAEVVRRCMEMSASNQLPKTTSGNPWRVFFHSVGFVPGSADLLAILRRLLRELEIISNESDLPSKLEDAVCLVCGALSKPSAESYIVIIDSINQLDEVNNKDAPISWLPVNPAPNVRIFVSIAPETDQYNQMRQYYGSWSFRELPPLSPHAKRQMVDCQVARWSLNARRKLTDREIEQLIAKPASDNALWLSLAVEELSWITVEDPDESSRLITKFPDTCEAIEIGALERVELQDSARICVAFLCLLECSVNGLNIDEANGILVSQTQLPTDLASLLSKKGFLKAPELTMESITNEKPTIPKETWDEINRVLADFYTRFVFIDECNRITFFHSSLARTVRHRYMLSTRKGTEFKNKIISAWFHNRLANFFYDRCPDIKRRCECFPVHAYRSLDIDRLVSFLTNWEHFDAMYDKDFSRALNKAWTFVYDLKMRAARRNAKGQARDPRQKQAPGSAEIFKPMQDSYLDALEKIYPVSNDNSLKKATEAEVGRFLERLERVAQILSQNGCFESAERIADRLVTFTECSTTDRALLLRSATYQYLKAQILDKDLANSVDSMSDAQLPKCENAVKCYKAAVEIFREHDSTDLRIGKALNRLAVVYSGIQKRGGIETLSVDEAKRAATESVEGAVAFYLPQKGQQANLADCYITRGLCEGAANEAQIDYYTRAYDALVEEYGYYHPLLFDYYLNIAAYWQESGDAEKAYDLYRQWYDSAILLLGPNHSITLQIIQTLRDETYANIAARRGDLVPDVPEMQQDLESDSDEDM